MHPSSTVRFSCHTEAVSNVHFKLKAPEVKNKSYELEWKEGKFLQADQKRGRMDYPALRWREKLSS